MEIQDNIQWHPAFCSAIELELREYKEDLKYEREHSLSKKPLQIDFLVIKKKQNAVIKNEIGDFWHTRACTRTRQHTAQPQRMRTRHFIWTLRSRLSGNKSQSNF